MPHEEVHTQRTGRALNALSAAVEQSRARRRDEGEPASPIVAAMRRAIGNTDVMPTGLTRAAELIRDRKNEASTTEEN